MIYAKIRDEELDILHTNHIINIMLRIVYQTKSLS